MRPLRIADLVVEVPQRRLFDSLSFSVDAGRCLAVVAPSGTGKTSLINCIAGLLRPASGDVVVAGEDMWNLSPQRRSRARLCHIGMVFQFGELIPELSAVENVALPLRLQGVRSTESEGAAIELLAKFGLEEKAGQVPASLSGGEIQRVALARALVHRPTVILADEPTGALDGANAVLVADLLLAAARERGAAVVVATHDPLVTERMDEVLDLRGLAEG
jgi:ABC-type lipoprotein export system ATPase subunit